MIPFHLLRECGFGLFHQWSQIVEWLFFWTLFILIDFKLCPVTTKKRHDYVSVLLRHYPLVNGVIGNSQYHVFYKFFKSGMTQYTVSFDIKLVDSRRRIWIGGNILVNKFNRQLVDMTF